MRLQGLRYTVTEQLILKLITIMVGHTGQRLLNMPLKETRSNKTVFIKANCFNCGAVIAQKKAGRDSGQKVYCVDCKIKLGMKILQIKNYAWLLTKHSNKLIGKLVRKK